MSVLVHELCECGTLVPRKVVATLTEPRVSPTNIVWCPTCRREFTGKPCAVPGCDKEASTQVRSHGHASYVCPLHRAAAEVTGMSVERTRRSGEDS